MALVKICGNTTEEDVRICAEATVDIIGFIIDYPQPVPWTIPLDTAMQLKHGIPPHIKTAAVTGGSVQSVVRIAHTFQPDYLQLHHNETLEDIQKIKQETKGLDIKIVKALRVNEDKSCVFEISELLPAIRALQKLGIDGVVIDACTEELPGGTGHTLDTSIYLEAKEELEVPLIIAGGIRCDNIQSIVKTVRPYAVDILTGAEEHTCKKSFKKVTSLVSMARNMKI